MVFLEMTYSVLVVSSSESFTETLRSLLPGSTFYPTQCVSTVAEARRKLIHQTYDLIIINAPLSDDFGTKLAMDFSEKSEASILVLVKSDLYDEMYNKLMPHGILTLSKPTSQAAVRQALDLMCATRERMRRLEKKQTSVEEKIEGIRLVNKAKWLLIENLKMSEPDAHRYIEKQAMDLRCSKSEIARRVIQTYQ